MRRPGRPPRPASPLGPVRLGLAAALLAILAALSGHADDSAEPRDYALIWTVGRCGNCAGIPGLEEIQMVSDRDIWALSLSPYLWGPGIGDFKVMHSRDAGRIWASLDWSWIHNLPVAFSAQASGRVWVEKFDIVNDEMRIQRTDDDGRHWAPIGRPHELGYFRNLRMFANGLGYAVEAWDEPGDRILRTDDGGRHWRRLIFADPPGFMDKAFFLGPDAGWVAGSPPGRHQTKAMLLRVAGPGAGAASYIDAGPDFDEVASLRFLDERRGWIVLWYLNDGGTRLLHTEDGGKTWSRYSNEAFPGQGPGHWITFAQFLDPLRGFAYSSTREAEGGDLFSTVDGGAHWRVAPIPVGIQGCESWKGTLRCGVQPDVRILSATTMLTIAPAR